MSKGIQTQPVPYCPDCGCPMVLRRPKPHQAWSPFWGCSQYPDCTGTRNIGEDGKPEEDDGFQDYGAGYIYPDHQYRVE